MSVSYLTGFDCLYSDLEFRDLDGLKVMCRDIDRVGVLRK